MLVAVTDLAARLPFVMDSDEEREAEGAIADLSFDAQSIGSALWTTVDNTPLAVKNLILRAAARHMKNYEGYTVSRAGDETVQWTDRGESSGTATFTEDEKKIIGQMGGRGSFAGTVGVYAYPTATRKVGYVGVDYAPLNERSQFPLFADQTEPW